MDYQKQYKEIIDNVDHNSFDSLTKGLEKILDLLESTSGKDGIDSGFISKMITKAEELKKESASLLMKEREQIVRLANQNGIPLSELGFASDSDDD